MKIARTNWRPTRWLHIVDTPEQGMYCDTASVNAHAGEAAPAIAHKIPLKQKMFPSP